MKGVENLSQSKKGKKNKLELERKDKDIEEIGVERELEYENRDELDSIMQRIDKFYYNDKK